VKTTLGERFQPRENAFNRAEPVEIWKARKFIHEHSDGELSLTKVAISVNISPNYLSEKFKQVTGVKFVDYIAHIRTEKARTLLQDSDLRVSEIAFAVGFQSLSQFNRVFKKLSHESPSAYRLGRSSQAPYDRRAPPSFTKGDSD
jgi:AraC-like DNA-binding protein